MLTTHAIALPRPFVANYVASLKGVSLGKAHRELLDLGDGYYQLRDDGSTALAGRSNQYRSQMRIVDDKVVVERFSSQKSRLLGSNTCKGFIDGDGQFQIRFNDKSHPELEDFHAYSELLDPAAMAMQLYLDIKQGETEMHYWVVDVEKVEQHRVSFIEEQTIDTELGRYRTLVFEHWKRDGRYNKLWLAPELDYQLVKAEVVKGNIHWGTVELTQLEFTD
ncbi:DUF3108 domain-containing protein [Aliagarivorans taiwanensis]|uniref:DUF3108 domain-containing protein n=1 Tax=Aliagarivorans taiwanensis TaxID=561966 RepID=UPI00146F96B2|nr:DUF3108 domain-containing protein [Aliagarivorans taiwanensis]